MKQSTKIQRQRPASPLPTKPGAAHQRLNVFIGRWDMEGEQLKGFVGPAAKITAAQTYEWVAGGFFMVQRFDALVGGSEAACIEIVGYDARSRTYPVQTYYNNGSTKKWQMTERDGIWTLTGSSKMGGKSMKVRCTTVFTDANKTMTGKWEQSRDDSSWQTFWNFQARKSNARSGKSACPSS